MAVSDGLVAAAGAGAGSRERREGEEEEEEVQEEGNKEQVQEIIVRVFVVFSMFVMR